MDIEDAMQQMMHDFLMESTKTEDPRWTLVTLLATFIHYACAQLIATDIIKGGMSEEKAIKNHRGFLEILSELILDESTEKHLIKELEKIKCKH